MKSFPAVALVFAAISTVAVALPTGDFFFPLYVPPRPNGPITANGANGGYNYGGNGANGGYIGISAPGNNGPISATGANGGTNINGNGANGGRISIGRRDEDDKNFWLPIYSPSAPSGSIIASGANGGYNYGGSGANGGFIGITTPGSNGAISISAVGANGGTNIYRREEEAQEAKEDSSFFWWPLVINRPAAPSGAITATGANGGYNYGGSGANGGSISIN